MHKPLPSKLIVLVDSREQTPLLFPATLSLWLPWSRKTERVSIVPKTVKLDSADYRLDMCPDLAAVERKGSMGEICTNLCSDDYARTTASLSRLVSSARFPYLMVEAGPSEFITPTRYCENPEYVLQRLVAICQKFNIRLVLGGRAHTPAARRALGTLTLHLLLGHWLETA